MKEQKEIKDLIKEKEQNIVEIRKKIANTKSKLYGSKQKEVDVFNHGFLMGILR